MTKKAISGYLKEIEKLYNSEQATEHSYRSALETLIRSFSKEINVINEPKRIDCGAPDLIVNRNNVPLGYIEAKDIDTSLDNIGKDASLKIPKTENGKQFKRYLQSLNNLILTDYLEFRWYVEHELRLTVRLAEFSRSEKLKVIKEAESQFEDLIGWFFEEKVPIIGTAKELATRMAAIARLIRDVINRTYQYENGDGYFHTQLDSFREVLIHDMKPDQFADMYAQTICYGLFTARYNHSGKEPFNRMNATFELPKTNPFLRKMFGHIAGQDLDEKVTWIVDNLAELLRRADMDGILKDFGKRTRREDPVVHFYETFLSAYDPNLRQTRGVYYTPEPVVSYIVRSIDYILKNHFGIKHGLADKTKIKMGNNGEECHRVLILDPAVGTGTFLYDVIDHIHESFKGDQGMWSGYVAEHLLPRLFGFELLMAPYAVAHMKLALQLKKSGYKFDKDERLNIFLTNTLEEAFDLQIKMPFAAEIANEANEAGKVKKDYPVMVILGNPPYSRHSQTPNERIRKVLPGQTYSIIKNGRVIKKRTKKEIKIREKTFIGRLIQDYFQVDGKPLGERNPKWLNDDYVKFIRFAQHRIEKTGYGILGFISNHGYLDNPTFRGMRQSLINTFDDIYILDLHGNAKKKEVCPDGSKDENVFDIQQGVAIGIFVKKKNGKRKSPINVMHYDLWGVRELRKNKKLIGGKYGWLSENNINETKWVQISPDDKFYLLQPYTEHINFEYQQGWCITEILRTFTVGVVTGQDKNVIGFSKVETNILARDLNVSNESMIPISYRPFDIRYILYNDTLVTRPRKKVMCHLFTQYNIALISARSNKSQSPDHFFCTRYVMETKCGESTTQSSLFPLYLHPQEGKLDLDEKNDAPGGRRPNLDSKFINDLSKKIKLRFVPDGKGDLNKTFGPQDVFNYIYGVFHSPTYRTRYAQFLKIDFPRLPLTSSKVLFRKLCSLGQKLVDMHLMEADLVLDVKYPITGDNEVAKVRYTEGQRGASAAHKTGKVWINDRQYFENVRKEVWEFQIGGYQVCHKWLKDRKGRKLSPFEDLEHYKYIVAAISETITLMNRIDKTINAHGGWPIE